MVGNYAGFHHFNDKAPKQVNSRVTLKSHEIGNSKKKVLHWNPSFSDDLINHSPKNIARNKREVNIKKWKGEKLTC